MLQKQEEAAHPNNLPISIPPQNPAQERPELGRSQNEEVAGSPGRGQRHQKIRITATETSPAPSPGYCGEPGPQQARPLAPAATSTPPPLPPSSARPAACPAPPPPPPPPPPTSMGVVAKFGVSGVPFAGKRPVRSSITLAEIRAGNSNLGPESPEEPVSTQGFLPNDYPAPEAPKTQPTPNLTNDYPTYGPSITSELPTMSQGQNALSNSLPPQVIPTPEVRQSGQNLKLQMPPNPAMSTNYHPQNA